MLTEYALDLCLSPDGYVLVADRDEGLVILQGQGPFVDTTAPAMITSLTGESFGLGAVRLSWYAPGDDRMIGQVDAIEVRMASAPITDEATWDAASVVDGLGSPAGPGELMEFVVTDLAAQSWYFAVRASDESGNVSALSNSVEATPGTGILLADPGLDLQGGTDSDTYTYEVTYVFPSRAHGEPGHHRWHRP